MSMEQNVVVEQMDGSAEAPAQPGPLMLDPFSFHGYPTSRIGGIGGTVHNPDPSYAFHTEYVPVARGHAHFTVKFHDLSAKRGTLWLRIHMLPRTPGAPARMVTSERIQINRLAHIGGELSLRFEAFRGATYAIMGLVQDDTDATASGLTILLDRPAQPGDEATAEELEDGRGTAFGSDQLRGVSQLISLDPPLLELPVSQPATRRQLREPAMARWTDVLGLRQAPDEERWQLAYLLQALQCYGMLKPGARGLALGRDQAKVARVLVDQGVRLTLTAPEAAVGLADVEQVSLREARAEALPTDLIAFDFLFSLQVGAAMDAREMLGFVERSMECLRPGGVAVHLLGYAPSESPLTQPQLEGAIDRAGLERIALNLISRGHQVARIKLALSQKMIGVPAGHGRLWVPFGLIASRAPSIL